ncbi:MAG: proton-conducting transporter membrane subunit [Cyclobacteriaceae bacterium]
MSSDFFILLILLSPALLALVAIVSYLQPGLRPRLVIRMSKTVSIINIFIAALSAYAVVRYQLLVSDTFGYAGLGFSVRLDPLSVLMLGMISLLAFVVIRFSSNYLDGDARQGSFMGRMAAMVASVQLLVLSGNLGLLVIAWTMTSLTLHRLLLFYPERPAAIIAARKKFIVARLADICLMIASLLLFQFFGTGDLEQIFTELKAMLTGGNIPLAVEIAALMLALAALLKSAQFPTHGWLIEVMETPTPVSALLHAGLLNAGPFLVTRMAFVMEGASWAPVLLLLVGGFTALFASVAFLTQPAIKTALGYSSVAHMGFMLTVCALGVYPAAMLHLVAHSFYKAHAFLSSGSAVEVTRASRISLPKRLGSPLRIGLSITISLLIYLAFAYSWGIDPANELALLATGAIVVMGLTQIIATTMDASGMKTAIFRAGLLALLVATAFFSLESGAQRILHSQLPNPLQPGLLMLTLTALMLSVYAATVLLQILGPTLPHQERMQRLAIHFRNGFYANACFDRLIGSLKIGKGSPVSGKRYSREPLKENVSEEQVMQESLAS